MIFIIVTFPLQLLQLVYWSRNGLLLTELQEVITIYEGNRKLYDRMSPFIVHYFEPKVQWGCLLEHASSFNHTSPVQGILYARLTIPLQWLWMLWLSGRTEAWLVMYYWKPAASVLILSWEVSIARNRLHRRKSKTYLVNWQSKLLFIPSDTGQVCTASDKNKTWAVARLLVLFVHTWWYQLSKSTMGRCSSWVKTASSWVT